MSDKDIVRTAPAIRGRANTREQICVRQFNNRRILNFTISHRSIGFAAEADADLKQVDVTESPQDQSSSSDQLEKAEQLTTATAESSKLNNRRLLYRSYIEKALRTKGLRKILRYFQSHKNRNSIDWIFITLYWSKIWIAVVHL